jgi:hypothetical protein
MKQFLHVCWIVTMTAMLAACGGNTVSNGTDSPTGGDASSTVVAASQTVASAPSTSAPGEASMAGTVTASIAGQANDLIGSLTRSGGITGDTQILVVLGDGTLQLLNGDLNGQVFKTAQASQAQVDDLKAAFASRDWLELEAKYGQQVPDGFAYTVMSGNKQVVTYDGAQNPHGLDVVLAQLSGLWQVAQTAP